MRPRAHDLHILHAGSTGAVPSNGIANSHLQNPPLPRDSIFIHDMIFPSQSSACSAHDHATKTRHVALLGSNLEVRVNNGNRHEDTGTAAESANQIADD